MNQRLEVLSRLDDHGLGKLILRAIGERKLPRVTSVSSVAEINAAEDFAETFRAIQEEPQRLKREAPLKYLDMRNRL